MSSLEERYLKRKSEKLNEEKLIKLGEIVFEKGDAKLIKIN